MVFRTDMAVELAEAVGAHQGYESEEIEFGSVHVNKIKILNESGSKALGKPEGTYVTITVAPFSDNDGLNDDVIAALSTELSEFVPKEGLILVIGLGNTNITPDALGPLTAASVLATRHITEEIAKSLGMTKLRPVAVMAPGVLGQTGIETSEITRGIVEKVKPAAVIVIDALASRRVERLGCTIQLANTGIAPGAGVGNKRKELSQQTLGVPVISLGVPTVVDATTLAYNLLGESGHTAIPKVEPRGAKMMVTPREIDLIIERASGTISHAINCALQPDISPEDLLIMAT